jgi:riboflavin synthase
MFNGLIETLGEVVELKVLPAGFRLCVAASLARELGLGESIAVNGACLTVVHTDRDAFHVEISPETARVTGLGALERGCTVNLERSMRADARVGGHFVQGHVDATGRIEEIRHEEGFRRITVTFPSVLATYLVHKGSIAVDGISLTVAGLSDTWFDTQIIPFTWEHTNLSWATTGTVVNLECDIIGKYVVRSMTVRGDGPSSDGVSG